MSRYCDCGSTRRPGVTDTREWASHGFVSTIRTKRCSDCGKTSSTVEIPTQKARMLILDGHLGRKVLHPRLRFKTRRVR